ncbi:Tudor domain-containing protein 6 [Channa argus]|uniref:Tudor domain-containing protein 6 n=1 Tax=Channa argus TaxID=215402 RepID=A0A6G1QJ74_CHAAH|nr:Tudor domain-containing protein 6 [Channa argus]
MSSIPGLPTRGANVTILITRVHLHPLCTFVEFWGKFSQDRAAEYEYLARDIQSPGYTFQEFEGNLCDQCLVNINGTWYRSRIVSRNGSKYSLYLSDKGITFSTTASKLAWGKKEHFYLPPEVEFCVLANVLPISPENRWSPVALEFLKSLCGKSVNAHVQDVLVPHRMFLLHVPCISKQMYEMGFAKKLSPDRFMEFVLLSLQSRCGAEVSPEAQLISMGAVERLHKQELFMYPELPGGIVETVIVTEVTNPQQIFCQLKVFSQELRKLSDQLTQCYEGTMTSCIVGPEMIGFPCAARGSDGRWHRSVLQQVFPTNKVVEVLNVDYGRKQFVQEKNVRPLAVEFFRMPVVTYTCCLHGITGKGVGWTTSQLEYLRNLLLCKTVIAKFEYQSISEGLHYVTLFGDDNININNLFSSKERGLLACEKTIEDYAICIPTYSPQDPAQQERNQRNMLTLGKTVEEKEGKEVAEMIPAEELRLNSSHVATVQHVLSPSEFWIQTQNYANELNELMGSIFHLYKNSVTKDVVRNPTVGLYCAVKAEDDDFYRAVVSEVGETQIKMFFVDYGNTEVVDKVNIRTLPDKFKKLPRLALKCALAGVRPKDGRWSQSASEFFIKSVTDKVLDVQVTAKHDDCYVVHLTDNKAQGERDLCALLCNSNLAERAETQSESKGKMIMQRAILPPTRHPDNRLLSIYKNSVMPLEAQNTVSSVKSERITPAFKEHMFPIGSVLDVNVSYIKSPNEFWCQLVQNAGHLKLLMHDMQAHYAGSEFQPLVEMACVARHPNNRMWYRALVIHKHETPHVDVLFVDYGQTETVSLFDLRRICPEFLTLQGQAFQCSLLNPVEPTSAVNEWNDEARARFHHFVESAASNLVILKCTIYAVMYSEQKIVFNIVDLETPFESVCTSMVNLMKSAPVKKACAPSFHLDTYYYSTHNIKTGTEEQVTVTCVNSVNQFYCQLERNADVIKDVRIQVGNLCHQLENLKLPTVFGTLCFAKYTDGQWYRGQIKATKPAILVNFVDYGDTMEVDKSDLLPVPKEASNIMSVPVQSVLCSLSDMPTNVPIELNKWFETNATDCKFRALIVAREPDGKLVVELYYGNTQINSKINKMFQVKMHTEGPTVYHGQKALEFSEKKPTLKPSKAAAQQTTEMEDFTQTVKKSCFSPQKPGYEMRDEPKSADKNPKCAQMVSCQKFKAAPLELYRPPHQRQPCGRTPINMGVGSELASSNSEQRKENSPTDTKQLNKSKSPGTESEKYSGLEKLPKLSDLPSKSITSGTEADIYVSHCNSPLSFYIQLVRDEDAIFSMTEKLNDPKSTRKTNDIKDLNSGDLVQAEFADDSSWYRAVVREIHVNMMALVEFIDFGNTAVMPVSKLSRLHKSFLELPVYAIHCILSSAVNLRKDEVSEPELVSAFKEDIGGNGENVLKCRFIRQSGSVWEVCLENSGLDVVCKVPTRFSTSGSRNSSETDEQGEEKPAQTSDTRDVPENSEEVPLKSCPLYFQHKGFLERQQLEVYIATINDDHTIWCQYADSEELDKITLMVSESVADHKCIKPESLSSGSPCIALFSDDRLWYRAEVINKDVDDLCVLFVDYGNVSKVGIGDVRVIPPDLVKTPPQAFSCELEGFDNSCGSWDSGALDELSALTADKLLLLTVTRVERNEEKIRCFVQMECDGQVINKVMKTWWKSLKMETKPDDEGPTPSNGPQCDSTVNEAALLEDPESLNTDNPVAYSHPQRGHRKELLTDELIEPDSVNEVKLVSSPDSRDDSVDFESFVGSPTEERNHYSLECNTTVGVPTMVIGQSESKDILPCRPDIEESMSFPFDDKDDQDILTLSCEKTTGETDKGSEKEGASVTEANVPDDLISLAYEHLEEAMDESEITTNLVPLAEDAKTQLIARSFDIMIYSDAPSEQEIEAGDDFPQELVPCCTAYVKEDSKREEILAHRDKTRLETQIEAGTEENEQLQQTSPKQKEVFDDDMLTGETSSHEDSIGAWLSAITHLSLIISDGSNDDLPVEQKPED